MDKKLSKESVYFEKEFEYKGFIRKCELTVYSISRKIWSLMLPDGHVMIGVGSALGQERFRSELLYLGADVTDWITQKFFEVFGHDKKKPAILVVDKTIPGQIAVLPSDSNDIWVLYAPDTTQFRLGSSNPYEFLDAQGLKQFEQQFADKCIEFMREQFRELYKERIVQQVKEEE